MSTNITSSRLCRTLFYGTTYIYICRLSLGVMTYLYFTTWPSSTSEIPTSNWGNKNARTQGCGQFSVVSYFVNYCHAICRQNLLRVITESVNKTFPIGDTEGLARRRVLKKSKTKICEFKDKEFDTWISSGCFSV